MGVPIPDPSSTPTRSGGGLTSLDMTVEKDRGLIRRAQRDWSGRWKGVDAKFKDAIVDGLKIALDESADILEVDKRVAARVSIAKTVVAMVGQIQADDHLEHKTDPDGSEKHKVEVVYVNRPRSGDDGRTDTTARVLSVVEQPALPSPERSGHGDDDGA